MVLSGLWHGASLTFVLWGAWHTVALWVERLWPGRRNWPVWLGGLITLQGVVWGWVCFRAEDWGNAQAGFTQAWGGVGNSVSPTSWWHPTMGGWALLMVAMVALEGRLIKAMNHWAHRGDQPDGPAWALPATGLALATAAAWVMAFGPVGVPPFIYAGF